MRAGQRAGGTPLRGDGGGRGKTADPDNQPRQPAPTREGRAWAGMPPRPARAGDGGGAGRARGAGLSLCGGRQGCRVSHICFDERGVKTPIIPYGGPDTHPRHPSPTSIPYIHPRHPSPTSSPGQDGPRPRTAAPGPSKGLGGEPPARAEGPPSTRRKRPGPLAGRSLKL